MGFRNPLNFPPGSITGSMLAADSIDGKTITGAKIRTAAPPAMRWELTSDAVNLLRAYSGDGSFPDPGGVEVGTGGSPASVVVLSPAPNGVTPAHLILRQLSAGGDSEVVLSSATGGGTLEDSSNPANNITWSLGDLHVPGEVIASGMIYTTTYAGTTDASGFLTVPHAADFRNPAGVPVAPAGGWAMTTNPNASFAQPWGIDTITTTSVRLRFANVAGTGAAASTAVAGRLFLIRP